MTGTVSIVTVYSNFGGEETTCLMTDQEIAKLEVLDVTVRRFKAETMTAEEIKEKLRCVNK